MITEQDIRNNNSNDTPIGLASRCWSADINFDTYCSFCNDIAITPVSQEDFEAIYNWWNQHLANCSEACNCMKCRKY